MDLSQTCHCVSIGKSSHEKYKGHYSQGVSPGDGNSEYTKRKAAEEEQHICVVGKSFSPEGKNKSSNYFSQSKCPNQTVNLNMVKLEK